MILELSDRPFKSLSQERRPVASVDELLKDISANNDSVDEDSTLEKDSSLDEGSIPAITNGWLFICTLIFVSAFFSAYNAERETFVAVFLQTNVYIPDDISHSKLSFFEKDGSSMASNDASFDLMASSLIPAGQRRRDTPDLFTPSSKGSVATCSTAKVVKTHEIMTKVAKAQGIWMFIFPDRETEGICIKY